MRELVQRFVTAERIVLGQFFEWISKLKFAVHERPSMFIVAVVFTHVCQETHVEGAISRFVSKGKVDQFATKLKDDVIKADFILKRCLKVLETRADKIRRFGTLFEKGVKCFLPQTKEEGVAVQGID